MTRNILEWLENAAGRTPHRTAYDSLDRSVSWGEIQNQAKRIGTYIARHVSAQSPVLILMEKGPDCIAAMLGSVWAGCFYTPLDSSMPEARMRLVAEVLKPAMVICEEKFHKTAEIIAGCAEICSYKKLIGAFGQSTQETASNGTELILSGADIDEALLNERRAAHIDTDLLYVLFTSGSTGIPKGVSITHRSVIDFIEWACEALQLPDGVRFGSQAPFYFDNSVLDIYSTMCRAGSLFLIPKSDFLFPKRLAATLQEQQIDTIFWVPSALTALAKAKVLEKDMLPRLRRVFFCGEVMPCSTLNLWKTVLPDADYVNMYGPTEITDVCSWYRVDRTFADTDALPIGKPCTNTRIDLIDGEICVSGSCLAAGYYNAPEKTEEVFIQNPLRRQIQERIYRTGDLAEYNEYGELMFLGRKDSQIKKSGYRIELGEVETALNAAEGVLLGCCWYVEEQEQITAVYTGTASEKEIRRALKKALPRYMIPDLFFQTAELPRTGSGKIDRMTLKQRYRGMK